MERVEILVHNSKGKEYLRAMVNRSSHAAPIPLRMHSASSLSARKKKSG